jgi:hypothetical protein
MLRTLEATIESDGTVKLVEQISLSRPSRALVTILDPVEGVNEAALLAESALAEAWSGPEEDKAWEHLNKLPDLGKDKQ